MKSPAPYAIAAVSAALLLAFLYLFSLPVVYWARQRLGDPNPWSGMEAFYRPVNELALRCPPYAAYLQAEADFLNTHMIIIGAP